MHKQISVAEGMLVTGGLTVDIIRGASTFTQGATVQGGLTVDRIVASKQIKATLGMDANGGLTADRITVSKQISVA